VKGIAKRDKKQTTEKKWKKQKKIETSTLKI
jgi:hypothetical protein